MSFPVISGGGAGRLGFVELVLKAFAFLLRLGFVVTRRDATFVRFERGTVFVNVYHGRSSYQVGLELGRMHEGDMYSLYEVLSAVAPTDVEWAHHQASDPEVLDRCLTTIAEIVDRTCRPLLAGNAVAFEDLRSFVSPLREANTLSAQFGALIDRADRAWNGKDYSQAADLYEKAAAALDEMRKRRLQYLRKRKKTPGG